MTDGLNIRQGGALDFVSLGGLVHPPGTRASSRSAKRSRARSMSAAASSMSPPTWRIALACRPASSRRWSTTHWVISSPSGCGRWASSRSTSRFRTTESPGAEHCRRLQ